MVEIFTSPPATVVFWTGKVKTCSSETWTKKGAQMSSVIWICLHNAHPPAAGWCTRWGWRAARSSHSCSWSSHPPPPSICNCDVVNNRWVVDHVQAGHRLPQPAEWDLRELPPSRKQAAGQVIVHATVFSPCTSVFPFGTEIGLMFSKPTLFYYAWWFSALHSWNSL